METRTLSDAARLVIDGYGRFTMGSATASVPYFNNKVSRTRMALRAYVGKGSPADIRDELEAALVKQHIAREAITPETMKKVMVDSGLGVDCSAFAYYVLDAESRARGNGRMNRRLTFLRSRGPIGKMRSYLRPAENCDVKTFASDMNSRAIALSDAKPGDVITMVDGPEGAERDHILVVTAVDCENGAPKRLEYSHAIAYPGDGLYGSGVKQGSIDIIQPSAPIASQTWSEGGLFDAGAGILLTRAQKSRTELRRLKWFS